MSTYLISGFDIDLARDLFLIAGPCVIESRDHAFFMAAELKKITAAHHMPFVFKASYDKANRTSVKSFRGPGAQEGLRILGKIKADLKVPVLTDIHDASQAGPAAEVCDVLQIPAFLARQTELLIAAGKAMPVAASRNLSSRWLAQV